MLTLSPKWTIRDGKGEKGGIARRCAVRFAGTSDVRHCNCRSLGDVNGYPSIRRWGTLRNSCAKEALMKSCCDRKGSPQK